MPNLRSGPADKLLKNNSNRVGTSYAPIVNCCLLVCCYRHHDMGGGIAPVPDSSTMLLLGSGLAGLGCFRRVEK